MKTHVELFPFALEDDAVYFGRYKQDISEAGINPDNAVQSLLVELGFLEPHEENIALVHSTSWRFEEGGVLVLTYLAYCQLCLPDSRLPMTMSCADLEGARQNHPLVPRPPEIQAKHILSHGLRHLSFLVRETDTDHYEDLIGKDACAALRSFQAEVAGQFHY